MKKYQISSTFLQVSIGFFIVTAFFSIAFDKVQTHIFINTYHHKYADFFFKYFTHLGDGMLFVPIILYFFYIKDVKKALFFIFVAVFTIVITALGKLVLFPNIERPVAIIGSENLHLIDNIKIHTRYSFPSGHTIAAFAFWGCLSVFFSKKTGILFGFIAVLVGFSRVYLSQHFLTDVTAGVFLGVLIALLGVRFLNFLHQKNEKTA